MYKTFINNDNVLAITTNRLDGVSKGAYSSLNLGHRTDDSKENVDKNYDLLCSSLSIDKEDIYFTHQTHSDNLVEIISSSKKVIENTDALYTKEIGKYIGVFTADCLPVLLYDDSSKIVAAIHAGWLGSTKLITYKTISWLIMNEGMNPDTTKVFIGPSIFQDVYEVGQDVYDKAMQHEFFKPDDCFIIKDNQKYLFDNRKFNLSQILACNIPKENITFIDDCTYKNDDYFSYRQDKKSGRQLSLIGMKK